MKRVVTPELLDTDAGSSREVSASLADLRTINRWFGGAHVMVELIRKVAARQQLNSISWLDVAGASGDIAALASDSLSKNGLQIRPVLLDRATTHLNCDYPCVCGDALALPFGDSTFDVVGCSLFIHHLEPQQVVRFMNEALRVARYAVLINDLVRHRLHLALAYAGYVLYRSRLTRHDAIASVRRAYTMDQINGILRQTSTLKVETRQFFMFRMGVIAWKRLNTI